MSAIPPRRARQRRPVAATPHSAARQSAAGARGALSHAPALAAAAGLAARAHAMAGGTGGRMGLNEGGKERTPCALLAARCACAALAAHWGERQKLSKQEKRMSSVIDKDHSRSAW